MIASAEARNRTEAGAPVGGKLGKRETGMRSAHVDGDDPVGPACHQPDLPLESDAVIGAP